jgi:tetratricopeptide (TPR) repeat protein
MAMRQIARINFNINKLDESKAWQKKVLAEEPKDAEAAFAVGLIDGMEAQQTAQAALAQAGLKDDYEGNAKAPASVMNAIKAQNGALVEEALQYLNQAVENRPDYDNAMTFMGLAYRRKADLDWGNEVARKDDVAKADEWIRKAKETHKANEEKNAGAKSAKP